MFELVKTDGTYASTPTLLSSSIGGSAENSGPPLLNAAGDVFVATYEGGPFEVNPTYTLNFGATRVGGTVAAQSLSIADGTTADPYQEGLIYALQNTPPAGFLAGSADSGTVVSGGTALASLNLKTTTAGNFSSTDTLSLTSTGAGTSGLGNTTLSSDDITLEGKVYAPAVAQFGTIVDFGVVHVGTASASELLTIGNTATGALTDVLIGSAGSITGTAFSSTGSLGDGVAAGSSGSLDFILSTGTSGVFSGSAALDLSSHDADQADLGLTVSPVTLTGTVDNYATAAISEISGGGTLTQSGDAYTINLGTLTASSSPVVINFGVSNAATGLADLLAGNLSIVNSSGAFINNWRCGVCRSRCGPGRHGSDRHLDGGS